MKKHLIFALFLIACLGILLFVQNSRPPFHHEYTLSLPDGITLQQEGENGNATLIRDGEIIGGILNCPYSRKVLKATKTNPIHCFSFNRDGNYEAIMSTLGDAGAHGISRVQFDHMMSSSQTADCELWAGNRVQEYFHYLYLFDDGILTLWFDLTLVDRDTADDIAANFSVTREYPKAPRLWRGASFLY